MKLIRLLYDCINLVIHVILMWLQNLLITKLDLESRFRVIYRETAKIVKIKCENWA